MIRCGADCAVMLSRDCSSAGLSLLVAVVFVVLLSVAVYALADLVRALGQARRRSDS